MFYSARRYYHCPEWFFFLTILWHKQFDESSAPHILLALIENKARSIQNRNHQRLKWIRPKKATLAQISVFCRGIPFSRLWIYVCTVHGLQSNFYSTWISVKMSRIFFCNRLHLNSLVWPMRVWLLFFLSTH